jgi:MFS family permease
VPPPARSENLEKGKERQGKDKEGRWIWPGVWLAQSRAWISSTFFNSKTRPRPDPILIPPVMVSNPDFEAQTNVPKNEITEKDLLAWMTVAGAWLMQFCTFGYIFTWGVYHDYYMNEFPKLHSPNKLALIGSLQFALPFLLAFLAGKAVDTYHFHWAVLPGSAFFGMSLFLLSFVDPGSFMHLFLIQGVGMGLGLGMIFLPTATVCMHHFKKRRAFITGIVLSGASAGAIVFPLVLDHFLPTKGFSGAVRITAYMVLACLVIGNSLMGMPVKLFIPKLPQVTLLVYFKERYYALAMGATFIALLTMYFPASYMEDYAVLHDIDPHLAFYALAITNIASLMGRIVMGLLADKHGSFNLLIPTTVVLAASLCAVVSVQSVKAIVIVSIFYGFSSGAWLSLLISGLASLAIRPTEIGLRTGLVLSVASLGALLSGPAQLGLLSPEFIWARPIGLFGFLLFVTAGMFWYIRQLVSLKKRNRIV